MPSFTLNVNQLGFDGAAQIELDISDRGRGIIIECESAGLDEEMILYGYTLRYFPAETESRETTP